MEYHHVRGEGSIGESTARTRLLRKSRFHDFDHEVKEGCGRLNELDDDELKVPVKANTRTTARELAQKPGLSAKIAPKIGHGDCLVVCRWADASLFESRRNDYSREVLPTNRRNAA